ncbi:glycosyltransferase [Actinoplanes awajinensis]|uniref:Glycosyl transferase n=1 Tax=Actinoplanes awajinensis subsp. mycoplanecinus TaxID=135947 RepID=A0A101JB09_9ACTN|nr:glycosyltransferase [Actinoplanes awajinensis]KUL23479.1 glycosyl transferase [Actinoplanes awajinensis subsp. mycoplanecinus]
MRVLHVITGLDAGGAEHQLRLLLPRLPVECEVVTLSHPGVVAGAIRAGGTVVHELTMRGNRDVTVVPRLVRLIRRGGFDLVHTHLYRACVYGRVAARLAGVPAVATEHSLGDGVIEGHRTSAGVRALYLTTERLGRMTIAVSGAVTGRLLAWGVPAHRITVIPNGIDPGEFRFDPRLRDATRAELGVTPDVPVVGAVGRMVAGKRFDLLVQALPALPGTVLLLVGGGPAVPALRACATRLGVADRVIITGETAGTREWYCAMDLFVSPSPRETFGLTVLEALASGLPAVYACCPALDDVPAGGSWRRIDRPAALPGALAAGLDRGGARLPVPAVVGHYDIARAARSVADLYQRIAPRVGEGIAP